MNSTYKNNNVVNLDDVNTDAFEDNPYGPTFDNSTANIGSDDPFSVTNNPDSSIFNIDLTDSPAETQTSISEMLSMDFLKNTLDIGLSRMSPFAWAVFRGIDLAKGLYDLSTLYHSTFRPYSTDGEDLARLQFNASMPFGFGQYGKSYSNSLLLARGLLDAGTSAGITGMIYGGGSMQMGISALLSAVHSFARDSDNPEAANVAKALNVAGFAVNGFSYVSNIWPSHRTRLNNLWSHLSPEEGKFREQAFDFKNSDLLSGELDISKDQLNDLFRENTTTMAKNAEDVSSKRLSAEQLASLEYKNYSEFININNKLRQYSDVQSSKIQSKFNTNIGNKHSIKNLTPDQAIPVMAKSFNTNNAFSDEYAYVLTNGGNSPMTKDIDGIFVNDQFKDLGKSSVLDKGRLKINKLIEKNDVQGLLKLGNESQNRGVGGSVDSGDHYEIYRVIEDLKSNMHNRLDDSFRERAGDIKNMFNTSYNLNKSEMIRILGSDRPYSKNISLNLAKDFANNGNSILEQANSYNTMYSDSKIDSKLLYSSVDFARDSAYRHRIKQISYSDGVHGILDDDTTQFINILNPNVLEEHQAIGHFNSAALDLAKMNMSAGIIHSVRKKAANDRLVRFLSTTVNPVRSIYRSIKKVI